MPPRLPRKGRGSRSGPDAYPPGGEAVKSPQSPSPIRNANMATFGEIDKFHTWWCENCANDQGYRDGVEGDSGCPIILEALFTASFPDEWATGVCDEFTPWTEGIG